MWDKALGLGLIISGLNFGIGLLIGILEALFDINFSVLGIIVQYLSAYTVGQVYAQKRGIVIPQSLNIKASLYATMIGVGLAIIVVPLQFGVPFLDFNDVLLFLGAVVFGAIVGFGITYFGLLTGAKAYIKRTRK